MIGTNWAALQPVPTTATRLPARSTVWSHRAEWNDGPAKLSRPSMFGSCGRLSWPTALITASASSVSSTPPGPTRSSVHRPASSSYSIDETSVPKRTFGRMPNSSRHWRKYRDSSACGE